MKKADKDIRSSLLAARLPVMPQILVKLLEHFQGGECSMTEVASLIAQDTAITSRILEAANNPAYHRGNHFIGLEQSLIALGGDTVRTLLISASVSQVFNDFPEFGDIYLRRFWKHSLTAALTARMVAQSIGYPHPEEAYLAGLLHDVGRLALYAATPKEYAVHFLAQGDKNLSSVEQRTLNITHPEAGAWLVERWHLGSFLADSVRYHHETAARLEKSHPLIRIIFLAHQISTHGLDESEIQSAGTLCGLQATDLDLIRNRAIEQVQKSAEYFGINLAGAHISVPYPTSTPVHDPAKKRLTEEVHNLVLTSEVGRTFVRQQDQAGLLETMVGAAHMLFNFDDAIVFLINGNGSVLEGSPTSKQQRRLKEFSIPLANGGVIAEAALQRRIIFIGQGGSPLGIVEEQLLRVVRSECLVCLPLAAEERCLGVIIGGVTSLQLAELRSREGLLAGFCSQASSALNAISLERTTINHQMNMAANEYREASRRVAHEVNNPLSIIKNYLSVLDRKMAKQEPISAEISILNEEIDRVGQIINALADPQPKITEGPTDVNRVINDVVRLFRDTEFVSASVEIAARVVDQLIEIESDVDTLKQILVNLVKNAVEAMPESGAIEIVNNGLINRDGLLYVEILVKDTGPGIPAELLAQLFTPVRSTKGQGYRGLGLSIVHGLVKKINALIICRSDKKGTTFELMLPVLRRTDQIVVTRSQVTKPT
jgi:putative nucleotidyltransferase with HDIG domain